jgi:hypothetical protein
VTKHRYVIGVCALVAALVLTAVWPVAEAPITRRAAIQETGIQRHAPASRQTPPAAELSEAAPAPSRRSLTTRPPLLAADGPPAHDTSAIPDPSREEAAALGEQQPQPEDREELQRQWSEEALDLDWSRDIQAYVVEALSDLDSDGQLLEADCRESLCRLRLHFADMNQAVQFGAVAADPSVPKSTFLTQVNGGLEVEAYLNRSDAVAAAETEAPSPP